MSIFKAINWCAPEKKQTYKLGAAEGRMEIKNFQLLQLSVHDESDFILSVF